MNPNIEKSASEVFTVFIVFSILTILILLQLRTYEILVWNNYFKSYWPFVLWTEVLTYKFSDTNKKRFLFSGEEGWLNSSCLWYVIVPAKVDCESEVKINPPVSEKRLSLKVNEGCWHCLPFCLEALANKNPSSRYGTTYRIIFSQLTSFQGKGGFRRS